MLFSVSAFAAGLIVVTININRFEFRRPSFDLAGPGTQSFFAVASPVLADLATVKADLREIRSDVERRMISGELADAECGIELFQDGIDLGIHPRKLAKLEGTAHVPRQNSHQLFQPLRIDAPMRRKLEQYRPWFWPQMCRSRQQVIDSVLRVF